jgi:hypothetical protein
MGDIDWDELKRAVVEWGKTITGGISGGTVLLVADGERVAGSRFFAAGAVILILVATLVTFYFARVYSDDY